MSKKKLIGGMLSNYLPNAYNDFDKDEKKYRCKIVNIETVTSKQILLLITSRTF